MAEEPQKPAEEVVATPAAAEKESEQPVTQKEPEKPSEKEPAPVPEPEPEAEVAEKPASTEEVVEAEEKPKDAQVEVEEKIIQSVSFKEETNVVGELPEAQKKALDELKQLIQEALNKHELTSPPPPPAPPAKEEEKPTTEEVAKEKKEELGEEKKEEVAEEKKEEVAEEKKEEEKPAGSSEETKTEEKLETEPPKEGAVVEEPPKVEAEPVTVTEAPAEKEKEEIKAAPSAHPPVETVVVTEVVEKVTAVDDDGAKTVEAIQESIVSVTAQQTEEAPSTKEGEEAPVKPETKVEPEAEAAAPPPPPPEEVSIWGISLLADERSDVILLKFLRARDFKVKDAFTMIKNTVRWRKEFGIDALVEEEFGNDWDKVVFTNGYDKEGHPVCYNVFGEFENKELYQNTFSDEEKRQKFIRWRIQFLEKSVRKFEYGPTGVCTIVQVNDLNNSPGLGKRELRQATNQALQLLQDNYPEFVAKQVFINVPWWYLAFYRMISPFLTQRTKSKFVFAGPSKSAETLFRYIAPEQVPIQYGGLKKEGDQELEFTTADPVTEVTIKPATKHAVEFPVSETCHLVWEVRIVGWDVGYGTEFVPNAEDGYTVLVQKNRKVAPADETVITSSFKVGEPGKIVLNIDNLTSKKKKLLYRFKTKPIQE